MKKKILVAPLDWGLGHATRCIPIIRLLIQNNCEVLIAGSGHSLELLRKEFSDLKCFDLPAYAPQYSTGGSMVWKMAMQLPKFLKVIHLEHLAIEKIVDTHKIQIVISDNRYGCWSRNAHSVFITHQSSILMPRRFGWLGGLVRRANANQMRKFSQCWIPDFPDHRFAGALASFSAQDARVQFEYIGILSRFQEGKTDQRKQYDVAAIFSGPEPQRSLFEKIVLRQLRNSEYKWIAVRGLPDSHNALNDDSVVNFMNSQDLEETLSKSEIVISRSGFSTVMDLAVLQKKAIFVPTPGQTEQEYLASRFEANGIAFTMDQSNFNLARAMTQSARYTGFNNVRGSNHLLSEVVNKLLERN
jgi:predicted glycosyltransferase